MLGYIFNKKQLSKFKITKKPIYITLLFLLICLITKILSQTLYTQYIDELSPFFKRCFANFLPSLIAYMIIAMYIKSTKQLKYCLNYFIVMGIINAIVSWLQAKGNPIGIVFAKIFLTGESETIDYVNERLESISTKFIPVPGIFGSSAKNGYMTACLGILPIYYILHKGLITKMVGICSLCITIIGCFSCQERSAFGLLLIFIIFSFIKSQSKALRFSIYAILFIAPVILFDSLSQILSSDAAGRMSKITEFGDNRTQLVSSALDFISEHFLLGGDRLYESIYEISPHNFLLHSFIYGGIIGAIIIIYLYIYLLRQSYIVFKKYYSNSLQFMYGSSLSILLLNSLFHSTSLITGDVCIWIFTALMLKAEELNKNNKSQILN